mmetsp:Transcript_32919/g.49698  ORF Transcript_32919/g.49698 Transcript_32919/m.49698 type:complete len:122 (-) Transcript_32919:230-595(-)
MSPKRKISNTTRIENYRLRHLFWCQYHCLLHLWNLAVCPSRREASESDATTLLSLVFVRCLISSSTILALAAESGNPNTPAKGCCAWIPCLYSMAFSIAIDTLFAKLQRVYLMFKSSFLWN